MLFKKLRCKHENLTTVTNLHDDAINAFNARSVVRCDDCGKIIYIDTIDSKCNKSNNIFNLAAIGVI